MMSNLGKMKEKLQKKSKGFRALCTYFFEQEDMHLQDLYVSSWSWMERNSLITITKLYSQK